MTQPFHLAIGAPEVPALLPEDGEYRRAVASLRRLPDRERLHLFAYEVVERCREAVMAGRRRASVDVWPEVVFLASGVKAHAAGEILSLLPASVEISWLPDVFFPHARLKDLGLPPALDSAEETLAKLATERGWRRRFPKPIALRDEPEERTAAGVLVRDGAVLLERRPPDARVTPGVWDIPGGHAERGEDPEATLRREWEEELGLRVTEARLALELDAFESPGRHHYRHSIFVVSGADGEASAREGQALEWLPPAEALRLDDLRPPTGYALQELYELGEI